jgi:hypothetical protein
MILKKRIWLIAGIFLLAACMQLSCKKDNTTTYIDMGYNYFPVNQGHWVSYAVDSTYWDDFTDSVYSFSFQIREYCESVFTDDQGRPNIRIERYKRNSDTSAWVLKDVWYGLRTASTAERVEENERFIKMIFPVKEGSDWNGNSMNTLGEQVYEYTDVDLPQAYGSLSFDSTVTVLQADLDLPISKDYSIEVFAKRVGLVYKHYIKQEKQITGQITKGVDYSYTITGWGDN